MMEKCMILGNEKYVRKISSDESILFTTDHSAGGNDIHTPAFDDMTQKMHPEGEIKAETSNGTNDDENL